MLRVFDAVFGIFVAHFRRRLEPHGHSTLDIARPKLLFSDWLVLYLCVLPIRTCVCSLVFNGEYL
jgi:hypothetical protein